MFNILIWSKDRPMQLDYCIRTLLEKFDFKKEIVVLYKYTNELFKQGFVKLKNECEKDVFFLSETDFEKNTKQITSNFRYPYTFFLCDDDCFINKVEKILLFNLLDMYSFGTQDHCLSLRMNEKINYCYPAKKKMEIPNFVTKNDAYIQWDWTKVKDQHTCWGYPMSIDSHIYKSHDIIPLMNRLSFHNVNSLESQLNHNRWFDKPLMLSFNQTKVFNVQNNYVKDISNPNDDPKGMTIEQLNQMYLEGYKIKGLLLDPCLKACHGYAEYIFNK